MGTNQKCRKSGPLLQRIYMDMVESLAGLGVLYVGKGVIFVPFWGRSSNSGHRKDCGHMTQPSALFDLGIQDVPPLFGTCSPGVLLYSFSSLLLSFFSSGFMCLFFLVFVFAILISFFFLLLLLLLSFFFFFFLLLLALALGLVLVLLLVVVVLLLLLMLVSVVVVFLAAVAVAVAAVAVAVAVGIVVVVAAAAVGGVGVVVVVVMVVVVVVVVVVAVAVVGLLLSLSLSPLSWLSVVRGEGMTPTKETVTF